MNADELFDVVTSAGEVLRVETLDAYDADSDADFVERFRAGAPKPDPSEKKTWLGLLAAARERGHPWRRLRVITRPVPEYVKYACEWGYVDNVAAGEDVRVIDAGGPGAQRVAPLRRMGDYWMIDGRPLFMDYTPEGRFVDAMWGMDDQVDSMTMVTELCWASGEPFTEWWARNAGELARGSAVITGA